MIALVSELEKTCQVQVRWIGQKPTPLVCKAAPHPPPQSLSCASRRTLLGNSRSREPVEGITTLPSLPPQQCCRDNGKLFCPHAPLVGPKPPKNARILHGQEDRMRQLQWLNGKPSRGSILCTLHDGSPAWRNGGNKRPVASTGDGVRSRHAHRQIPTQLR